VAVARPMRVPSRGEVYLVELDHRRGSEIQKTRPCLVISPDELNHHLRTVIVAPMTTGGHTYPFRPTCRFGNKEGCVALDQIGPWIASDYGSGLVYCRQQRRARSSRY
jgi:mRNA interferase MazF